MSSSSMPTFATLEHVFPGPKKIPKRLNLEIKLHLLNVFTVVHRTISKITFPQVWKLLEEQLLGAGPPVGPCSH